MENQPHVTRANKEMKWKNMIRPWYKLQTLTLGKATEKF